VGGGKRDVHGVVEEVQLVDAVVRRPARRDDGQRDVGLAGAQLGHAVVRLGQVE
jgi:hypothetical protein